MSEFRSRSSSSSNFVNVHLKPKGFLPEDILVYTCNCHVTYLDNYTDFNKVYLILAGQISSVEN